MDPYAILGLQRGASEAEAKAAFKKLAKTCHPDLHPNDPNAEKRFKEINDAYDRIKSGNTDENPFREFRFDFGGGNVPPGFANFEDIIFSQGGFRAFRKNADLHLECRLMLEEIFTGKEMTVQIPARTGENRSVKVDIPPGMRHGMRVKVPGGGHHTNTSLPPGDLYMTINQLMHNRFTRDNSNNLMTVHPVSAFDVMLGKPISVTNIEGKSLSVDIPPKFDSMQKLRIKGHGMPDPYTKVRGDLLIELFITYPVLTEDQRKLIEQAAK